MESLQTICLADPPQNDILKLVGAESIAFTIQYLAKRKKGKRKKGKRKKKKKKKEEKKRKKKEEIIFGTTDTAISSVMRSMVRRSGHGQ